MKNSPGIPPEFLSKVVNELPLISLKLNDTFSFIFYVRAGLTTKEEIYASAQGRNKTALDSSFIDFLFSIGHPTNAESHAFWSGNTRTSYRVR